MPSSLRGCAVIISTDGHSGERVASEHKRPPAAIKEFSGAGAKTRPRATCTANAALDSFVPAYRGRTRSCSAPFGCRREDWPRLATAFRRLAECVEVCSNVDSSHGQKYIIDGPMETPSGKTPLVRTVWIVDAGQDTPRLVTAYPREE